MEDRPGGHKSATLTKNLLLFAALLTLSVLFFSLVRNNTFWHAGDYAYLSQALKVEQSFGEVFAPAPAETFQPLVNIVFYLEYRLFGLNARYYYLFNIFLHALNALLVYFIVFKLLKDRTIAVVSSLLFVFAVGNYGKAVMVVSGVSDLLITLFTLLTLFFYFKNELEHEGRITTAWFYLSVMCFLLILLTKTTSFSTLGCMLAFNIFFRGKTQRNVFDRHFLTIAVFALVVLMLKLSLSQTIPGQSDLVILSTGALRNLASYLVRMVFPIHFSHIVADSGIVVRSIYSFASQIRIVIFLCILSYSVFGFIFGNRTIRFFIAWTYITVAPFCFFRFPSDWLNIRYLYLVSVGFVMILASGTALATRLLYQKAWRRFLPYVVPALFVLLSFFVVSRLDSNYEQQAVNARMLAVREHFMTNYRAAHPDADVEP